VKWLYFLALGLGFCGLCGCKTDPRPAAARFASVELQGHTPREIAAAAIDVFRDQGYRLAHKSTFGLVFEQQGSNLNNLAYGSWIGDQPVWQRVTVDVIALSEGRYRVQCHVVLVRDRSGPTEEELNVRFRSGPFQKMMDEIARRLGAA
jgi:hypothetical protein